jgi:hypothetical protein
VSLFFTRPLVLWKSSCSLQAVSRSPCCAPKVPSLPLNLSTFQLSAFIIHFQFTSHRYCLAHNFATHLANEKKLSVANCLDSVCLLASKPNADSIRCSELRQSSTMSLLTTPIWSDGERISPASHAGTFLGSTKRTAADAFNDIPTSRDGVIILNQVLWCCNDLEEDCQHFPSCERRTLESGICADCERLDFESIMQKTQGDLPEDGLPLCSFGKRLSRNHRCAVCAFFAGFRIKDKLNYRQHLRAYNPVARGRVLYDAETQEFGLALGGMYISFLLLSTKMRPCHTKVT